jgi:hypothetical protein
LTLPSLTDSVNQGRDHLPCREALSRAALNQSQRYHGHGRPQQRSFLPLNVSRHDRAIESRLPGYILSEPDCAACYTISSRQSIHRYIDTSKCIDRPSHRGIDNRGCGGERQTQHWTGGGRATWRGAEALIYESYAPVESCRPPPRSDAAGSAGRAAATRAVEAGTDRPGALLSLARSLLERPSEAALLSIRSRCSPPVHAAVLELGRGHRPALNA